MSKYAAFDLGILKITVDDLVSTVHPISPGKWKQVLEITNLSYQ